MRLILSFLLIMVLAACNLANATVELEEVAIGMTVVPTTTPLPSATAVATNTPLPTGIVEQASSECTVPAGWVIYTVQSGDTLFSIAQSSNSTVDALVDANCLESANVLDVGQALYLPGVIQEPLIYWLTSANAINSDSIEIGCETYITPIETQVARQPGPTANITTALEALFETVPQAPYHNYWGGLGLTVRSVGVDGNGIAHIIIDGDFLLGGVCSDPEIIAQVLLIIFAEPQVQSAIITVDGMNLRQISDMSGRAGADARFTRDNIPFRDE